MTTSDLAQLLAKLADFAANEGEATLAVRVKELERGARAGPAAEAEVREGYQSLLRPKEGGLADFFRWHPDFARRKALNDELKATLVRIEQLLGL